MFGVLVADPAVRIRTGERREDLHEIFFLAAHRVVAGAAQAHGSRAIGMRARTRIAARQRYESHVVTMTPVVTALRTSSETTSPQDLVVSARRPVLVS